jgi:hypothetical protein
MGNAVGEDRGPSIPCTFLISPALRPVVSQSNAAVLESLREQMVLLAEASDRDAYSVRVRLEPTHRRPAGRIASPLSVKTRTCVGIKSQCKQVHSSTEEMVERLKKCNARDLCGCVDRPGPNLFCGTAPKFSPIHSPCQ